MYALLCISVPYSPSRALLPDCGQARTYREWSWMLGPLRRTRLKSAASFFFCSDMTTVQVRGFHCQHIGRWINAYSEFGPPPTSSRASGCILRRSCCAQSSQCANGILNFQSIQAPPSCSMMHTAFSTSCAHLSHRPLLLSNVD